MNKLENPLNDVVNILKLELFKQNFIPLLEQGEPTKDCLSIVPEYMGRGSAKAHYGVDEVLKFNCSIQRRGEGNLDFVEFTDEIEFYNFLATYTQKDWGKK